MMMRKLLLFIILTPVFIALALPLAFAVQPQYATLSVDPPTGIIEHPTYTINIKISQVTYLFAVNFRLDFNTPNDCLEFANVEAGNLMAGANPPTWSVSGNSLFVLVRMPSKTTVNGSGSVAKITFNLKETAQAGMISQLSLPPEAASGSAILPDGTPQDIVITDTYSGSVEVGLLKTTLTINVPPTTKVNTPTTVSATLKDGGGNPIPDLTIDYYIRSDAQWNPIGSDGTDASGIASIDHTFTSVGNFSIKAEFSGNQKYAPSNDTDTITVAWSESTLTLTVLPLVLKVDETITASATLKDKDSGNPLQNYRIDFYIYVDDEWNPIGHEFTDASGIASINYAPTAAGTFEVNATYWGSQEYTHSSDTKTIQVLHIETTLTINLPATATVDKPTTISATLEDKSENPIEGETIRFYILSDTEWNPLASDYTDATGIASISHAPTEAGTFRIKAQYDGSTKYDESSDMDILTVSSLTTTLSLDAPTSAKVGDTINLVANLKDEDGKPIPNSTVSFRISKGGAWTEIGSTATNSLGVTSTNYKLIENGTFKLKAVYEGTQKYAGSSSEELTLEVSAEGKEGKEGGGGNPLSFLLDEKLTTLDILFWAFIIVSFSTLVFIFVWKKIK